MASVNQQEATVFNLEDIKEAKRHWNEMSDEGEVVMFELVAIEGSPDEREALTKNLGKSLEEILEWAAARRVALGMPQREKSVRVELKHGGHAVMRVTETGVDVDVIDRDGHRRLTMQAAENISMTHSGDFAVDEETVRVPLNSFRHAVTEHELPA